MRLTKKIGDIYLLDEIGHGAFAIVYKGIFILVKFNKK